MSENPNALKYAAIILDTYIDKTLDYAIPMPMIPIIRRGARVEVTVRGRKQKGTVHSLKEKPEVARVLSIQGLLPQDTWVNATLFELGLWMAKYYVASLDEVFRCMVPPAIRKEVKPKEIWQLSLAKTKKASLEESAKLRASFPAQSAVLEILLKEKKAFLQEVLSKLKISKSPVDTLIKKKWIKAEKTLPEETLFAEESFFPSKPKKLKPEQKSAFDQIGETLDAEKFQVHLLHGITGSGKTEVYMQLIAKALDLGKSALVLVPEVALTAQLIEKFRARFQEPLAILHHKRSLGEKNRAFSEIQSGKARLILGARSAIFSPAKNLGIIIVDEEHDSSYKQTEEAPAYHARDVAIKRGQLEKACVVLGSATPSLESFYKAETGKYALSTLSKRASDANLPFVRIIDMKKEFEKAKGFTHFSDILIQKIKERYEKGEQTLLFLNRRGYRTSQICAACSHVITCPHCDLSLTFHKTANILRCHICDYAKAPLRNCPNCNALDAFKYKGFGTEHVEKTLHALLPEIRTLRMDRDTTTKKRSHEEIMQAFRSGKADVLIGTQMIAKGFHFPFVTLVGVLNPDGALFVPDFRAQENLFQLLTQVAGRAGREELPGEVFIQTHLPENQIFKWAISQDFRAFYEAEKESRKFFLFPPYARMAKCVFSGGDAALVETITEGFRKEVAKYLQKGDQLYPTNPCHPAKIKDRFRFQFVVRTKHILPLTKVLYFLKTHYKLPSKVRLFIDIDPKSIT